MLSQTGELRAIEEKIKNAFLAPNGMGPTSVIIDSANSDQIKMSINIPAAHGVKTKSYILDENSFNKLIAQQVRKSGVMIAFQDVVAAYQDTQTQSNEVATLRAQAADTGAQHQAKATEARTTVPEAASDHREIVEKNRNKAEGAQSTR